MKRCSCCKIFKKKSEFNQCKLRLDNLQNICRNCSKSNSKIYRRTKKGLISKIFNTQIANSKKRNHNPPSYSKEELFNWVLSQPNFDNLYNNWVASDFQKKLVPSIDRLDDYKGYSFKNIKLTTWENNDLNGRASMKNGENTKTCKAVVQLSLNGEFIKEHYSMSQASRETNAGFRHISNVCKGKEKTSRGFIWMYKEDYYANLH